MDNKLQDPNAEKRAEVLTKLAAILAPSISRIMLKTTSEDKNNKRDPDAKTGCEKSLK